MMERKLAYDVIVVGGGTTGVCAAVSAARAGARTALIELQGFLGGNACNGMAWYGFHSTGNYRQVVGGLPLEIIERLQKTGGASSFCMDPVSGSMVQVNSSLLKLECLKLCLENNVSLHLHSMMTNVFHCDSQEQCIEVYCKTQRTVYTSKVLIDCTDSGDVAVRAGAQWHKGRKKDGKMQVASSTIIVAGIDMKTLIAYFTDHPDQLRPIPLPLKELTTLVKRMQHAPVFGMGAFPDLIARAKQNGLADYPRDRLVGQAFVDTGEMLLVASRVEDVDPDDEASYTGAEITGMLQMEATLILLRKYLPGCQNARITGSGHTIGIRETKHIYGDYYLSQDDVMQGKAFPDAIAFGAYHLDVHSPDHQGIDSGQPPVYQIPYRSLLPKGIDGLLVAGRTASADHYAQASTRVIPIAAAVGQAAGTAAGIAVQSGCDPRHIDVQRLRNTLKAHNALL